MGEACSSSRDGSHLEGLQLGEVERIFQGAGGTPWLPPLRHKGRPRFQFIQFNRCETRYISFGVMDASITEDKCEGINMRRHGRNQTERTGWVHSPLGVLGSFLLRFSLATDTGPAGGVGKEGKKRKINPKSCKKHPPKWW